MKLSKDAQAVGGVVLTAVTAFVAVAPCPMIRVPKAVTSLCVFALLCACLLRSIPLVIGVCHFAHITCTLCDAPEQFSVAIDRAGTCRVCSGWCNP
jgi:hypothetical protein